MRHLNGLMLTFCPCCHVCVCVCPSPLCVTYAHLYQCFMNVSCMNSYPCVHVCYIAFTSHPPRCTSYVPCLCVCTCPSHPSRAVHLYISENTIEIDSSDGMISDPSTKDSSSSEEEGPSSDDDDGGGDSDWGGGDRTEIQKLWCDANQGDGWRDAQMGPMDSSLLQMEAIGKQIKRSCATVMK